MTHNPDDELQDMHRVIAIQPESPGRYGKIIVLTGRRKVSGVKSLSQSIDASTLIQPINVRPLTLAERESLGVGCDDYILIDGLRRIKAAIQAGRQSIVAIVQRVTPDESAIMEIDANLERKELTALERAEAIAQRKELMVRLEGYRAKAGQPKKELGIKCTILSATEEIAAKTGLADRTVKESVRIAKSITPQAKEILATTPIADRQKDLDKIAHMSPKKQLEIAEEIKTVGAASLAELGDAAERAIAGPGAMKAIYQNANYIIVRPNPGTNISIAFKQIAALDLGEVHVLNGPPKKIERLIGDYQTTLE